MLMPGWLEPIKNVVEVIVKLNHALFKKQMNIARVAEPRDKITREDLMILRKSKKKKNGKTKS